MHILDKIDREQMRFDTPPLVVEAAKRALDAAGIQIPFPHLQLFWEDVEDRVVRKLRPEGRDKPAA